MRLNRQHVMHTYLDSERKKPPGRRDVRVDGAGATAKRKRSRLQVPSVPFTAGQRRDSGYEAGRPGLPTPSESSYASDGGVDGRDDLSSEQKKARPTPQTQSRDFQLVPGINRTWPNSRYIRTDWHTIPFHSSSNSSKNLYPDHSLGSPLNPFNTWPAFSTTDMDISRLKWSCSQRFGSYGLSTHWVPELLRARHAFLSTICISSAHDDIMSRASLPSPNARLLPWPSTREGVERLRVRSEVIGMVNSALGDPALRVADATIISVLHLLNSEIMGCDDRVMKTHQDGLHRMVRQRGGLESLGVRGQLARVVTITMYMISVIRESPPHGEFVAYANKHNQDPQSADSKSRIPESPIYCPPTGFRTITKENCPSIEIWSLLGTLRNITTHFFSLHCGSVGAPGEHNPDHHTIISSARDNIFALPSAENLTLAFPDLHTRSLYEALRLTALLYAHALASRTPFSVASAHIARTLDPLSPSPVSLSLRLRETLLQTDTSILWGPLAGVLCFITLVSGAASNPGPLAQVEREGEGEDARKFLAALSVRCSIVLSFEHGGVVLEMLRRLVAVEGILAQCGEGVTDGDCDEEGERIGVHRQGNWMISPWTSEPGVGTFIDGTEMVGPEVPPSQAWTQMADFAWDFDGLVG